MQIHKSSSDAVALQMTPMIDIVFQLLVFFIMTFKIVAQEGDFDVHMPTQGPVLADSPAETMPPLRLILRANGNGNLSVIEFNGRDFGTDFGGLNEFIRELVAKPQRTAYEDWEVEIAADYQLDYRHVIAALTAVSGYERDGRITKLIEKIKFTKL